MKEKKKYTGIKKMLRNQIATDIKVFWTWEKGSQDHFTMIYQNYGDDLKIYTPQQLLEELEENE